MKFVSEPAIADKIRKMNQRVKWQDPLVVQRGIDQTRLMLDDGRDEESEFSFLVVGDSGTGSHYTLLKQQNGIRDKLWLCAIACVMSSMQ
ncbi:hypothetical protein [Fischerella thermalis]|uniref:hypothetical protein n=1 Tax=Fischerella thermalis TaxID=372787 RepID=UPI000361C199|nr:hypothetical protein [Fischerella thermalis]